MDCNDANEEGPPFRASSRSSPFSAKRRYCVYELSFGDVKVRRAQGVTTPEALFLTGAPF